MTDLAVAALLIGLLTLIAVAAYSMSLSQAPDPNLVLLARLMRKSHRQSTATRPPSLHSRP